MKLRKLLHLNCPVGIKLSKYYCKSEHVVEYFSSSYYRNFPHLHHTDNVLSRRKLI